jgi:uncharacterized membrane protein
MLDIVLITLLLSSIFFLLCFIYMLGTGDAEAPEPHSMPEPEEMYPWIVWRSFYVNPNDPRGWVSKTHRIGWTVNFRTKRNAAYFALILLIIFLLAIAFVCSSLCTIPQ